MGRGCEVFIKYEGLNPTGSFKDRGMTMAVSKALEAGARPAHSRITGNTCASAAAYAARARIACMVLLPGEKSRSGRWRRLSLMERKSWRSRGIWMTPCVVREIGQREDIAIVNSINPFRIEGQKTASFEIIEVLGDAPDIQVLPVGNAGNISAYWMGYGNFTRPERRHEAAENGFSSRRFGADFLGRNCYQPGDDRDRHPNR